MNELAMAIRERQADRLDSLVWEIGTYLDHVEMSEPDRRLLAKQHDEVMELLCVTCVGLPLKP